MKIKQAALVGTFWLSCLTFGYFGSQKLGAITTIASGVAMGTVGAILLPSSPVRVKRNV